MTKSKFEIFTKDSFNSIPANMILVKNKHGWMFLTNEGAQWFVNHTNTFNENTPENDETVIKAIIKQIKFNNKVLKSS